MNAIVYAVRHGETEWNSMGRQQGHLDSPLTGNGIRQSRLLAEGLARRDISALYSSDLGRALQTAEIIAKRLSVPVRVDPRLRERHLGILQGLTQREFRERYPDEAVKYNSSDPDYVLPGGESLRQCFARGVACAEEISREHAGGKVLIVSHGGVLRSFFQKAAGVPLTAPRRFSLFNASINAFHLSGGEWNLDTWGETAHLENARALDDWQGI